MTGDLPSDRVKFAFEPEFETIPIADIIPLRIVGSNVKASLKYGQIKSSIHHSGLAEPPVVARDRNDRGKFLLLDGHIRLAVLQEMEVREVNCLVATDDEAYTYNKRISRLAIVQEHQMILKAIKRGVPEETIAKVLNLNIASIRTRRRLLTGICPEVVELLKDKHVPMNTFTELRKMKPLRQIEAAQLMVTMNKFSITYAKSLLSATPPAQLVEGSKSKKNSGLSQEQIDLMEQESANLDREVRLIEESYGKDHLDLVIAIGYVRRLLENARVVRHLAQHYPELLAEFQKMVDS
ncbi:plasmid partitioning protein RepB C-terminal domain-containing protein [uncultured Roseibium sp.]|uniref:plasmid partitioning protein RepB C-terminal domain-containing protein n=1 Tax=uncultured Roseibium sp. TaxID=1936171 RepID=UPI0026258E07|nr:plasmid partitioning protein RepB C-terminal domain-containing protein [uncultured Roseibium sp.]